MLSSVAQHVVVGGHYNNMFPGHVVRDSIEGALKGKSAT